MSAGGAQDEEAGPPEAGRLLIPDWTEPEALQASRIDAPVRRLAGATMGTTWSLAFAAPEAVTNAAAMGALEDVFAEVIRQMSNWEPASELSCFNRAAAGDWRALPGHFFRVLQRALEIAERTGGAFDPAIAAAVERRGFGAGADWPEGAGWRAVRLDAARSAALQPGGAALDLSSIAKGYAVDVCADALGALGAPAFLMEIGGEFVGRGVKPDGTPWMVDLELSDLPPAPGEPARISVAAVNAAVATSGDFVRRRSDGASHLLDGRTRAQAGADLSGVCVIAPRCMDADGWATGLYALGLAEGMALADAEGLAAIFARRTPEGARHAFSASAEAMLG